MELYTQSSKNTKLGAKPGFGEAVTARRMAKKAPREILQDTIWDAYDLLSRGFSVSVVQALTSLGTPVKTLQGEISPHLSNPGGKPPAQFNTYFEHERTHLWCSTYMMLLISSARKEAEDAGTKLRDRYPSAGAIVRALKATEALAGDMFLDEPRKCGTVAIGLIESWLRDEMDMRQCRTCSTAYLVGSIGPRVDCPACRARSRRGMYARVETPDFDSADLDQAG